MCSERVVQSDAFTSVHIYEYTCTARDTKLGEEEITADIPNIGEEALGKLDVSGLLTLGLRLSLVTSWLVKSRQKVRHRCRPKRNFARNFW